MWGVLAVGWEWVAGEERKGKGEGERHCHLRLLENKGGWESVKD